MTVETQAAAILAARRAEQTRQDEPGTDVDINKMKIRDVLHRYESQFEMAIPAGFGSASSFVAASLSAVQNIRDLNKCDNRSIIGAVMSCAQLGLRVGLLGHAWPLPFWDRQHNEGRGGYRAQLVIGYQGLIELMYRSGMVKSVSVRPVHDKDMFDYEYGTNEHLVHKPARNDRGEATDYYAIIRLTTGDSTFWVMSRSEVEAFRDRYAPRKRNGDLAKSSPWFTNFDEMAAKTVLRQGAKWVPKSPDLATALLVDGGVRADFDPTADLETSTAHPTVDGEVVREQEPGREVITVTATVVQPPTEPTQEPPSGADPAMVSALEERMAQAGMGDRTKAARYLTTYFDRPVMQVSELSAEEGRRLWKDLSQYLSPAEPPQEPVGDDEALFDAQPPPSDDPASPYSQ